MTLLKNLEKATATTLTENLGLAVSTTTSALVDLFAISGAMRTRPEDDIRHKFNRAFSEDNLLATKMAFYTRNVRGGLGERRAFRAMLKELVSINSDIVIKNLHNVPHFGRWDDLFVLFGTKAEKPMVDFVKEQLLKDIEAMEKGESISLLSKWLPSINTSSKETKALAKKFIKAFRLTEREYRKTLSALRKYTNVVEVDMSAKEWGKIKYETVPSKAMNNYRKAFAKRDEERFNAYIESVKKGETKINAATLFPYNITEKMMYGNERSDVLEEQWKALPNYIDGENNILVMADVSESMWGRPMATSVGLAIYFAERNKGPFAGKYMTFTDVPKIRDVKGTTLYDKLNYVRRNDVGYNTNLELAFEVLLNTAIKTNCSPEDMPVSIVVISDMEIDNYRVGGPSIAFQEEMERRFNEAGYEMPNMVYWNVQSRQDTYHAFEDNPNVQLVSGQSPATFKVLLETLGMNPYEAMVKALSDPMYDCVVI